MKFVSHIEESVLKLDTINQKIWEKGFNIDTLSTLTTLTKEVYNGTTVFERIPQAQQSGLSRGSALLCSAVIICRGCPRTESENREIYSTDDLIGDGRIQEVYSPYRFYPSLFLGSISVPYLHQRSSQAKYSRCQRRAFCGERIQWFSSGKITIRAGTPIILAALKAAIPCS